MIFKKGKETKIGSAENMVVVEARGLLPEMVEGRGGSICRM